MQCTFGKKKTKLVDKITFLHTNYKIQVVSELLEKLTQEEKHASSAKLWYFKTPEPEGNQAYWEYFLILV